MPRQVQNNQKVALLTDWGKSLGTGHVQRMLSLLKFLVYTKKIDARIVCSNIPSFIDDSLIELFSEIIPQNSTLIIRDQRDSDSDTILKLKKISPVIVIDDQGDGRKSADFKIDLLPIAGKTIEAGLDLAPFIFGYNFSSSLDTITGTEHEKIYDFCIYLGYAGDSEYRFFLKEIIPHNANVLWLDGEYVYHNNDNSPMQMNFAEALLKSKAVISHFGLLLYEAYICGCQIFCINPSVYHSELADTAKLLLDINNFGKYPDLDKDNLKSALEHVPVMEHVTADLDVIKKRVVNSTENFFKKISHFLNHN